MALWSTPTLSAARDVEALYTATPANQARADQRVWSERTSPIRHRDRVPRSAPGMVTKISGPDSDLGRIPVVLTPPIRRDSMAGEPVAHCSSPGRRRPTRLLWLGCQRRRGTLSWMPVRPGATQRRPRCSRPAHRLPAISPLASRWNWSIPMVVVARGLVNYTPTTAGPAGP